MKDTCKILRQAIFNALSGLSVPVYDEKQFVTDTDTIFVLLGTQQESSEDVSETFITKSSIDIEIISKTASEASKDDIDDVYQEMMEILIPTTQTVGLVIPSGFQFQNAYRESSITQSLAIDSTQTILRRLTRLTFTITQK